METVLALLVAALWLFGAASRDNPAMSHALQSFGAASAARSAARRAKAEAEAERRRAERASLKAERQAQKLAQERLRQVERQMVRGRAGFGRQEQARAALRSRGGRPNPLDGRKYK
jgi:hypothetical protein